MQAPDLRDPYAMLGLGPSASADQIRSAYRALARAYHPDLNPTPDAQARMRDINWAYGILGDPEKRVEFDARLRSAEYAPDSAPDWSQPRWRPRADVATSRSRGRRVPAATIVLLIYLLSMALRSCAGSWGNNSPASPLPLPSAGATRAILTDIRGLVDSDSVYFRAIRHAYPDYGLTTSTGLSDEVLHAYVVNGQTLNLETQHYGTLRIALGVTLSP